MANAQRDMFKEKVSKAGESGTMPKAAGKAMPEDHAAGGKTTTITHNDDGSHSVKHADGESSEHPNTGHMLMGLHAKHAEGEGHHMHIHGGGHDGAAEHETVTTHHVGMDGEVEGPTHHAGVGEALDNASQMYGDDGVGMEPEGMPAAEKMTGHGAHSGAGHSDMY